MNIKSYQDLQVWQDAMTLAEEVYRLTGTFPHAELFGMTSQMRRASVSIPSNIAEGWGRGTTREYAQFTRVARGSLKELETQLLLSARVGLTDPGRTQPLLESTERLGKMLAALIRSLEAKS